jgi:hypothetical protein
MMQSNRKVSQDLSKGILTGPGLGRVAQQGNQQKVFSQFHIASELLDQNKSFLS